MKVYLGNLSKEMNDAQLGELVAPFGKPTSASIATERSSGASRGFGFVEFASDDEAKALIAGLDGKEVNGHVLKVNESRPKTGGKPEPAAAPQR
jgi:RNA recognition motif-containing protein